ncbi:hypothetical protein [uncultured Kordia sp.]|uniref:hypothetical protein n=1 Tax=uncultured Kordia sp. TaxID=507699 RepID=UPI002634E2F3|nr:hypothetical protein [uncultured Kordia sp.]
MNLRKISLCIFSVCILILGTSSCSNDDQVFELDTYGILSNQLNNLAIEEGGVLAYAYSDATTNHEDVYLMYYVEDDAFNIKFYETESLDVDENEYSNYQQVIYQRQSVFNGFFQQVVEFNATEKWMIITYRLNNVTKISNPIRIKHEQQPTIWESDGITIDQQVSGSPAFTWDVNPTNSNAVYFQIVSQAGNVLSATHTNENQFQYYDTSNVGLDITEGTPPALTQGEYYYINLLDIGQDNWINRLLVVGFEAE